MKTEKRREIAFETKEFIRRAKRQIVAEDTYRAYHYLILADEANDKLIDEFDMALDKGKIEKTPEYCLKDGKGSCIEVTEEYLVKK